MLSKQVKQRRNINFNRRQLRSFKGLRTRLAASMEMPSFRALLAGRRLNARAIYRQLDTPVIQSVLSSKHVLILDDQDVVAEKTWCLGLQQRMIDSESRRRSNFSSLLD